MTTARKALQSFPGRLSLVLCVAAALASAGASADKIDLNAEIVKRLQKAGKLNALYKSQTRRDLPANLAATAIFEGEVAGRGLKIAAQGKIASSPLVLQQDEVVNCNTESMEQELEVNSSATNSSNFENTDQIESSREYTVTVGYDSPWGASASASTTG